MKKEIHIIYKEIETKDLARKLAQKILSEKTSQKPIVIGLLGDLGAGKTTFLQGFANGLGVKERVLSPTFVILRKFKIKRRFFYHIDCYRLKSPKELLDLGFKEIIHNHLNIIAVEWADKVKKIMPKNSIWIKIDSMGENKRRIIIDKLC
ncbi:MAG: tRNA (adenosine(37)-N6)-threonylcarbamoyltransferase complex ATPase subunit type 1 TsaE [Candidatus Pacebacteria bacterium]|nr:tRNA (adenosine(37)-N6)-threonylcarbamoyltransferase complex ATPase subunit type 1 TsaE [Candidatus Paceibacterota bacterium]